MALRAPQRREASTFAKTPSKNPLFFVPELLSNVHLTVLVVSVVLVVSSVQKKKTTPYLNNPLPALRRNLQPLQSYNPGDQLRKCRSPVPTKVPKKCFGKCRPQTGCRGKCRKSASAFEPLYCNTEARRPKHFFGTFLGTPFGAGTFRSTFSALLSGRGFGTSVAGRQDCNSKALRWHVCRAKFARMIFFELRIFLRKML